MNKCMSPKKGKRSSQNEAVCRAGKATSTDHNRMNRASWTPKTKGQNRLACVCVCLCACMRVSILEELREEQLTKRGKSQVRHPAIVNFRITKAPCRKRETVLSEGSNCALLEGHMSKNMYVGSTNWSSSVKRCGRELEKWLSG